MPVADGCMYDAFLSYAHVDDLPVPNSNDTTGWVTVFYETLKVELRKRLGRTDVELWKDDLLGYHQSLSRQLIDAVRSSAILVVMLSPGYVRSGWCVRERAAFMQAVRSRGDAPVFVVAKEWIEDAKVPVELRDYKRFPFFSGNEKDWATFGDPRPNPDNPRHAPFYDNIVKLSRAIAGVLNMPIIPPKDRPPLTGKRVFLAETTDDLEGDRDKVRAFLDQLGIEVLPASGVYYPFEGKAFREAVKQELRVADVFVQLLGGIPGRRPLDAPHGYPLLQWELATGLIEKSLPVLQWCSPSLDISAVKDEHLATLLRSATVRQESLVDFQRAIVAALKSSPPPPPPSLVCVNVDNSDRHFAGQIQDILKGEKTEFISIWFGGNALDNRELMENGLRECDGVIVVYGQAKDSWVDRQLLECRKSRAFRDRPFAALGIFQGPPPDAPGPKPPINVYLDGLENYDCRGAPSDPGVIEREVRAFLDRLRANIQAKAA